ncbi:hypothetical protein Hanom_Chr10g00877131 [Helianthus anomalus]
MYLYKYDVLDTPYISYRLNTMGYGAWVGHKRPRHHPGGLGLGRGPLGWGFSLGVGRGYPHDMTEPHWPRALAL